MFDDTTILKFIVLTIVILTWVSFVVRRPNPLPLSKLMFYSAFFGISAALVISFVTATLNL